MGSNAISVHRNNSISFDCTVTGLESLSGYTGTVTVKKNKDDAAALISETGSIADLVITFDLDPADTDLDHRSYHYDIVIADGTDEYTLVQDQFRILESVSNNAA